MGDISLACPPPGRRAQPFTPSVPRPAAPPAPRGAPRRGRVFTDRYHATTITKPRQARHALAYVLNNWRRHREDIHDRRSFDPFASARAFDGWANNPRRFHLEAIPVVMATTWHLTHGWRRYGPIETHARPGPIEPAR